MRPRRNIATMPVGERVAFANAVLALHAKPSQRGLANRYDDFAKIHVDAMAVNPSWGHGGPAFTAWHRVLLAKFEAELRLIDDSVRIPFWDWTVDRTATSAPWFSDFFGGDGGATNPAGSESGEVTTGPFRFSAGGWTISAASAVNDDPFSRQFLARGFGRRGDAPALPTAAVQTTAMGSTFYSDFRFGLEVDLHNLVHRWVNGQMILRASPHEPVFWLHHCNLDRLWAVWMRPKANADRYTAPVGAPTFHQPTGNMIFNIGGVAPWTGTYRPVDVIGDHPFDVWYEGDPPIVTLETPSVSFLNVEAGRTTYAAVVFRVEAVDTVGFEVLSAVPAPFGLPAALNPPAAVPPGNVAQHGRVWLSFSAPAAGPIAPITVSVRCIQTGQIFNVPITANVVATRTAAMAIVADRSGSMAQNAGNGMTKRQKLGQALGVIAGLARDTDQISLIQFDDQHGVLVPRGNALAAGAGGTRDALNTAATGPNLDPRGATGIGAGILDGVAQLAGAATDTVALVVITDGVENVAPMILDVAGSLNANTFAVGIGRPTDVNVNALRAICQGNNGYLLVTGDLAGEELFRLHKYLLQVHAGVTNAQIVTDPAGELTLGVEHRIPFRLCSADFTADIAVLCPLPEILRIELEAPDGSTFDRSSGVAAITPLSGSWLGGLRLSLPVLPTVHAGSWTAVISLDPKKFETVGDTKHSDGSVGAIQKRGTVPYSLVVTARSDLELRVRAKNSRRDCDLVAVLDDHGVAFTGSAYVWGIVTDPFGRIDKMVFDDHGAGRFRFTLPTPDYGLYQVRVIAEGKLDGEEFTREQTLTIATASGKPSEGNTEPDKIRGRPSSDRPVKGRSKLAKLDSLIRTAKAPQPIAKVREQDFDLTGFTHVHDHLASSHFPSRDELPPPVRWETVGKGKPRTKSTKPTKPTKPTKSTGKPRPNSSASAHDEHGPG